MGPLSADGWDSINDIHYTSILFNSINLSVFGPRGSAAAYLWEVSTMTPNATSSNGRSPEVVAKGRESTVEKAKRACEDAAKKYAELA